jgi:hypothetical protein
MGKAANGEVSLYRDGDGSWRATYFVAGEARPRRVRGLTEFLDRRSWISRRQLAQAIFEWIEIFYHQQRRHSTLGMLDPVTCATAHPGPSGMITTPHPR